MRQLLLLTLFAFPLFAQSTPRTILMRGEHLAESRRLVQRNDPSIRAALKTLLDSARLARDAAPVSVMEKRNTPPSGNKHDYMSMAPYWWPDSTRPDGRPFIRRDGVVYPPSRVDHDGLRFQATVARAGTLAMAFYLTGNEQHARAAAKHLRVFFLDTATRMTPNLRYAQAVLGVSDGRGIGIIDTESLPRLVDALRLLERSRAWTTRDREGMQGWLRTYLAWLLVSENGRDEQDELNNHGTFYDAQVAALALFLGDTALARIVIGESARARLDAQIDSAGGQPLETARTRPLHYSIYNLHAFTTLAEMGRHVRVDLWRHQSPKGASLEKAIRVIAPYADSAVKWPTPQVRADDPAEMLLPLRRAARAYPRAGFADAIRKLPADVRATNSTRFAFPGVP